MLGAVLISALFASAQVKVSLSDLVFEANEEKEVSIILDNEDYILRSVGGDIIFPGGFTFTNMNSNPDAAGVYVQKTNRCPSAWSVLSSTARENDNLASGKYDKTGTVLRLSALQRDGNVKKAIKAGSGAVFTFKVKAPEGWNPNNEDIVTLRNFSVGGIGEKGESVSIKEQKISMLNSNMTASFNAEDVTVTPNHVATVTVGMESSEGLSLCALQYVITLPEGLSFVENEEGDICVPSERLHATSHNITTNLLAPNKLKAIIDSDVNLDIKGNSGALFTFGVECSADFTEGQIAVTNIIGAISPNAGRFDKIGNLSVKVTNPDVKANAEADAAVKALEDRVAETLKAFGEYPDSIQTVLLQQREALEKALVSVQEAAKASRENGTAASDLETLKASVAEVEAMAGILLEDAAKAQKDAEDKAAAEAANAAQHDKDLAAVKAAQEAYDAVVAGMAEYDESVKTAMAEAQTAAETAVKAAQEAAEKSFAAGTSVADVEANAALVAAANEASAKLAAEAKAAQDKFLAEKEAAEANAAQNALDVEALAAAQTALDSVATVIAGYDESVSSAMQTAIANAQAEVNVAKVQIEASFKAGTSVADAAKNAALVEKAQTVIAKVAADARKAQEEFLANQDAANAAQYNKDMAAVKAAQAAYDAAVAGMDGYAESVKAAVAEVQKAAQAAVTAAKESAEASFAAGTSVADKDKNAALVAEANTAITKLVEDAQKAQADYETEQALNAAYAQATEVVAGLNQKLEAATEAIETFCPDVKDSTLVTEAKAAIEAQIADLGKSIEEKKADGTLTTELEAVLAPKAGIEAAISQMLEDARKAQKDIDTGIEGIEGAENISQIYTLSGKRVSRVEKGNVYIIRFVNGSTKKIMVK